VVGTVPSSRDDLAIVKNVLVVCGGTVPNLSVG